jgi:hypothetical protein
MSFALYVLALLALAASCFGLGWMACARRNRRLAVRARDLERRMDAYRVADTRTDLDVVGPIRPTPIDPAPPAWVNDRGLS